MSYIVQNSNDHCQFVRTEIKLHNSTYKYIFSKAETKPLNKTFEKFQQIIHFFKQKTARNFNKKFKFLNIQKSSMN